MKSDSPHTFSDTIAALATAPGGALAILRISGPDALAILNKLCRGAHPVSASDARRVRLMHVFDSGGESVLALYMPGPASYTGEDVAEIHSHGGDFAPGRLLRAAFDAGARPAEPGEFTRRAFLNGKMDLTQAEAVADLIGAKSHAAGLLAERQMAGRLGSALRGRRGELIRLLADIESRMDFPEEELDWMTSGQMTDTLAEIRSALEHELRSARAGALIRDGIRLVIAGAPNAGKSSLLNALLGYDRSIVTDLPGTTRDTVEESLSIGGIRLRATDTAGLRGTGDAAEQIGVARARTSIAAADIVLWLLDLSHPEEYDALLRHFRQECPADIPVIVCWTKADLPHGTPPDIPAFSGPALIISAQTGRGLAELSACLEKTVWAGADRHESETAVSERHAKLLRDALPPLRQAAEESRREEWELAALHIRQAAEALGRITGETVSPDILDEIFSRFCIGK